jgi:Fe2+ transport system protein FeoA
VRKSDRPAQVSTLAELPTGVPACITRVDAAGSAALACHGIRPGAVVSVESDAPFGGPRIIRLGRARVAIARSMASGVAVRVEPAAGPAG